jgi:uncharacterized RDD family membrane protein YckC
MCDHSLYVPASIRRRFGALVVNIVLLSLLDAILKYPIFAGFQDLYAPLALVAIVALSVLMDSPGKRVFKMKVLYDNQQPIGAKGRLIRNMPILVYYVALSLSPLIQTGSHASKSAIALLFLVAVVFVFADVFAVLFTPENRSLLDLRLRTRVCAPRPPLRPEPPAVFGMRVW